MADGTSIPIGVMGQAGGQSSTEQHAEVRPKAIDHGISAALPLILLVACVRDLPGVLRDLLEHAE